MPMIWISKDDMGRMDLAMGYLRYHVQAMDEMPPMNGDKDAQNQLDEASEDLLFTLELIQSIHYSACEKIEAVLPVGDRTLPGRAKRKAKPKPKKRTTKASHAQYQNNSIHPKLARMLYAG